MTVEDLQLLGPRQRQVMELRLAGLGQREIAGKLGLTANNVAHLEYLVRQRLGSRDIPRRPYGWQSLCRRGHQKTPGQKCVTCCAAANESRRQKGFARAAAREAAEAAAESPEAARTRIAWEVSTGKRCGHQMMRGPCCLLRPCADHGR